MCSLLLSRPRGGGAFHKCKEKRESSFFFFFFFFFEFFLPQPLFSIPAPVPLTDASKRRKTHR